jgi:hypothetical protein
MFAVAVAASAALDINAATPSNEKIFFFKVFSPLSTLEVTFHLSSGYASV